MKLIKKHIFILFFLFYLSFLFAKEEERNINNEIYLLQTEIYNLENSISFLKKQIERPSLETIYYPYDKKLLDAELFFEMKLYEKSATIYGELVEDEGFKKRDDYFETLYKLGHTLYLEKNFFASSEQLKKLLTPQAGVYFNKALAMLFEIAVSAHNPMNLQEYGRFVEGRGFSPAESDILYSYGKYLYMLGNTRKSLEILSSVPHQSPYYYKAKYYCGVIFTKSGDLNSAIKIFNEIINENKAKEGVDELISLTYLSLGRLFNEVNNLPEALINYAMVHQRSIYFPAALYEMAWVYLKQREPDKSLHILEMLLINQPNNSEISINAQILKGRILIQKKDFERASETYEELTDTLTPLRKELENISSDESLLNEYFEYLIKKHSEEFALKFPLRESTLKLIESDENMKKVISIFTDVSQEKEKIIYSLGEIEKLKLALKSKNRVDMFPKIKDAWIKIQEYENKLLRYSIDGIKLLGYILIPSMSEDEKREYEKVKNEREKIVHSFLKLPSTGKEFYSRAEGVSQEYLKLQKNLFLVESALQILRGQLLAVEDWLKENKYKEEKREITPQQEKIYLEEIEKEKQYIKELYEQILGLKNSLENLMVTSSGGELLEDDEITLIEKLKKILFKEEQSLSPLSQKVRGEKYTQTVNILTLLQKSRNDITDLDTSKNKILSFVRSSCEQFEKIVLKEEKNLQQYLEKINKSEFEAMAFSKEDGFQIFREIQKRLSDIVLEADIGLIDLSWEQKIKVSKEIQESLEERTKQTTSLYELEKTMEERE